MKILLYSRPLMKHTPEDLWLLMDAVRASGFEYKVNGEFAEALEKQARIEISSEQRYDSYGKKVC